ncbi:uncharacterized protein METZ01_LOCUS402491, partial [marine metagenome]
EFNNDFELAKSNVEYFIRKYRGKNTTERTDAPPNNFADKIAPLEINFEKFKEYKLKDYQIGDKDVFNKNKLKISDEYNNICQTVAKKIHGK